MVKESKSDLFPKEISVRRPRGWVEVEENGKGKGMGGGGGKCALLFGNLMEVAEKMVDFRLMIEGASGAGGGLGGGGEREMGMGGGEELSEEELKLQQEVTDLTPVLINENDLRFEKNKEDEVILGKGGFGRVIKGWYRNNEVAVKMMRGDMDTEQMEENLSRFRRGERPRASERFGGGLTNHF